jgi:hypothetical protein
MAERRITNYGEGSSCCLIKALLQQLPEGTEEYHEILSQISMLVCVTDTIVSVFKANIIYDWKSKDLCFMC